MNGVTADVDLSIVIPTHDTARLTLACCRAAIASSSTSTEIIVVDDASSDDTCALLRREVPSVTTVRLERNLGFAGAANAGVAVSRGRIVLLLNSDARLEPDATSAILGAFAADPKLGVAGARLVDDEGSPAWSGGPRPSLLWLFVTISGTAWLRPRLRGTPRTGDVAWVSGAAMAFRRETWSAVGPLREHYRFYAQDLDFCIRAGEAGWKVRIVEAARVVHEGGTSVKASRDTGGLPHDPAMLWLDLLTWGREYHGDTWAAIALRAARAAAALRIAARRAREPFLHDESRAASRRATDAYTAARRRLTTSEIFRRSSAATGP